MKHRNWLFLFSIGLVTLSVLLFTVHFLIFHDFHHIFIYTLHDIAFLPIEVLLVTIVIHSMLERQNLQHKFEKLNMVFGAFFSEVGNRLLREFARHDPQVNDLHQDLLINNSWDAASFKLNKEKAKEFAYMIDIERTDLIQIRDILLEHEDFLLRILENPVMLEHEAFTDVLMAVFHLTEELKNREHLEDIPETDLAHIRGDIKRAYSHMTLSWLDYIRYLKKEYPYLFSLAVRLDPFTSHPDACVRD